MKHIHHVSDTIGIENGGECRDWKSQKKKKNKIPHSVDTDTATAHINIGNGAGGTLQKNPWTKIERKKDAEFQGNNSQRSLL